jgi:hypothetical protein
VKIMVIIKGEIINGLCSEGDYRFCNDDEGFVNEWMRKV